MLKMAVGGFILGAAVASVGVWSYRTSALGQDAVYAAARTPDGHPDLNGIWQAMNTANWDIQDHGARQGPILALGAAFSVPAGQGVVEGDEIPVSTVGGGQEEGERRRTG